MILKEKCPDLEWEQTNSDQGWVYNLMALSKNVDYNDTVLGGILLLSKCVWERERDCERREGGRGRECVCVCVKRGEMEKESKSDGREEKREREIESVCVCVCVCVLNTS